MPRASREPDRHKAWLAFLRVIERQTPEPVQLHLIVDGFATHRHPEVQAWLARHPRVVAHALFAETPWLKRVQRVLRDIAGQGLRRQSFAQVPELLQVFAQRTDPGADRRQAFVWTARPRPWL